MASLICRLLPFACAAGTGNMATDEVMLHTASRQGTASLRFYGWSEPTVSLGYFQPFRCRLDDPLLTPLPYVRRPSGGKTLVHHHELTYALALPGGSPWYESGSWLIRVHRIIAAALRQLGVELSLFSGQPCSGGPLLCFQQHTVGDLLWGQNKVVGSAQRRHHQCLLQHGGILLACSSHAPVLPGLRDLTGLALPTADVQAALIEEWHSQTGWRLVRQEWEAEELLAVKQLIRQKYSHSSWNEKR